MARTPRELLFRLTQEAANLYFYAAPPKLPSGFEPAPLALPPVAGTVERLRDSRFATDVQRIAESILRHQFPVLGLTLDTGPTIEWRKDYVHGQSTSATYFRRIPYLDFARCGDHKNVWELSRHQHLVLLAQAWLLTGRREFIAEIWSELESWLKQNPFQRGIHWSSALEVAFRALSWIWIWHFAGTEMPPGLRSAFLTGLYRHGLHLESNLSIYFSPNTHLLGEAVALHALGLLFPGFPRAGSWRRLGRKTVLAQMEFQVQPDGSHFEHSTYYHIYALDMFLLHHALEPAGYTGKLRRMATYLDALMGEARSLVCLGDDDGGRLFHPFGLRSEFGRATLATCAALLGGDAWHWERDDLAPQAAWWLGDRVFTLSPPAHRARSSQLFEPSGVAVMCAGPAQIVIDAGPFGHGGAGHSHSDSLSLTARVSAHEILIDPGTYTYVAEPRWRDWFRGSAAHNTVRVDGSDQARAAGPFRWEQKPDVRILEWVSRPDLDYLDAICAGQVRHRRRVLFCKPDLALILDEIDGPAGQYQVEQFWHLGDSAERRLRFPDSERFDLDQGSEHGWRSPVFGSKEPAGVIRLARTSALPTFFAAAIDLAPLPRAAKLDLSEDSGGWRIRWSGEEVIIAYFPRSTGLPELTRRS